MISRSRSYDVPGVSCEHCREAVAAAVTAVGGVRSVEVDLERKLVIVAGQEVDDHEVRAAIEAAGYDVAGVEGSA